MMQIDMYRIPILCRTNKT